MDLFFLKEVLNMSISMSVRIQKAITWLFATKCGVLGGLFALCGGFSLAEMLLNDRLENAALSVVLLAPAAVLLGIHAAALQKDRALVRTGRRVSGQADGSMDGVLMHSGPVVYMRHFSVRFHYTVDGVTYNGRSRFYWTAPILQPDGKLTVYVDPAAPQRCAVDLWAV